jgi:selT/selW/selH-like putative selenoprotein
VRLIESSGGVFEVSVDDRLVYSKKRTGRHAAAGEIVRLIASTGGS